MKTFCSPDSVRGSLVNNWEVSLNGCGTGNVESVFLLRIAEVLSAVRGTGGSLKVVKGDCSDTCREICEAVESFLFTTVDDGKGNVAICNTGGEVLNGTGSVPGAAGIVAALLWASAADGLPGGAVVTLITPPAAGRLISVPCGGIVFAVIDPEPPEAICDDFSAGPPCPVSAFFWVSPAVAIWKLLAATAGGW
ncbi:MAG: hypothetical protein RDV48_31365 [Candidatus Eremiobacteraeota bacterium]|nr:hypothetical protein [Candidatus Eremiobacteraeota bacterium]